MGTGELPSHKTAIVATIGPASDSPETLKQLILAGMSVVRLNFSHGTFDNHARVIERIRAAERETGRSVAILADLPGPKIRLGEVDPFQAELGDRIVLTTTDVAGTRERLPVRFEKLPRVVKAGDLLSINDGLVQLEVQSVAGTDVACVVRVGGEIRSRKGLNLPGIDLGISAFTERDRECLTFAMKAGVDAVSQSFVESAADLKAVRSAAEAAGGRPFLVAKIERARALDRLDEILEACDGVMIARGDLGVEIPIERIALVQKDVMRRANLRARPVITATQMLESMTASRLPTRAEATDVSNAILDGTDAVMLSAESATGAYPVEAVAMLARIAREVEPARRSVPLHEKFRGVDLTGRVRPEHLIGVSVEASLDFLRPAAIVVPSSTGMTARFLGSLHLPVWVVAVARDRAVCKHLEFSFGVSAVHEPDPPASWTPWVRDYVRRHGLQGDFAVLVQRAGDHDGNHRMEIVLMDNGDTGGRQ